MSGLKNEPVTGGKFLNFKDGAIISAASGEKKSYTSIEGLLTELDIVDEEYKGKEYRKIVLFILDDEGETWKLGFPLESGYGNAFCSIAPGIDFKKPVKISGGQKDLDNGMKYGVIFIKQPTERTETGEWIEWKSLKWFYKSDSPDIPRGEKKKDRSGEYTDYSERNDFFHEMLIEKIRPAILIGIKQPEQKINETRQEKKTATAAKTDVKKNSGKA